ncbi:rhamnulokinase [Desertihabitans brevis]|uniref:Rhamnulokinase n=2 Tax=Desertihabitans brevis TaxID=2268447 RepID=A0A367YYI1_9ACTN|nr:rhamnulokinase [Desertihabitans brevis]
MPAAADGPPLVHGSGTVLAVDLGATSGRVVASTVGPDRLDLEVLHRFPNEAVPTPEGLRTDLLALYRGVLTGLEVAGRRGLEPLSIGVDSWAVDYGLLRRGRLLAQPVHYRDGRTAAAVDAVHERVPFAELYRQNGLQFLPFTTLYQLVAEQRDGLLDVADQVLLLPDLLACWLGAEPRAELTNASTTGLLTLDADPVWNTALAERLGLDPAVLPPLVAPGTVTGTLSAALAERTGLPAGTDLVAVGSHDTASAVVGVPMEQPDAAYVSCGTWGLVGLELDRPVVSDGAREAGFTNELGVDGRIRFLHNVMGLWVLSQTVREWEADGTTVDLPELLRAAAGTDVAALFDVDDPVFLAPGPMTPRITRWLAEHDRPVPSGTAAWVATVVASLAQAMADAVATAGRLAGRRVGVVHLVGGGALNDLLARGIADRSGLPVLAGPVEATALGNVLVQARAAGLVPDTLEGMRALVRRTHPPRRVEPGQRPS